ncbi:ATP synthase F1 subunit delta [Flavobacterium selenitireducens]|uniref:ATP synthase F1 subunit delta n=1 Tax=Flavobacterium selenitireducens TaxID=2722704 RepID=UPI00168A403C|nr:ATP synthase F1 subunit delta [Flavobacterium selenitireducens]MBD3581615.1 ATP synthase F1 subunit delta [Flavobacterium selenitireducens]
MSRAAIRYAKAILDMAHSRGVASEVNTDMAHIAENLDASAELKNFLESPIISNEVKEKATLEVFASVNGITQGLFRLLKDNKRFEILGSIATEYSRLFEDMNGVEVATVTTAVELDKEMEGRVMSKILEFTNKKVVIENVINPEIIGGFILRIGDKQYNASVSNRLNVLKRELSN